MQFSVTNNADGSVTLINGDEVKTIPAGTSAQAVSIAIVAFMPPDEAAALVLEAEDLT